MSLDTKLAPVSQNARWKKHLSNWRAYAAASGASLAAATSADAGVHYTTFNTSNTYVPSGNPNQLATNIKTDLGVSNFLNGHQFGLSIRSTATNGGSAKALILGNGGVGFFKVGASSGANVVNYLNGTSIGKNHAGNHSGSNGFLNTHGTSGFNGNFAIGQTGFAGLVTSGGNKGYIKLRVNGTGGSSGYAQSITLLGVAWADSGSSLAPPTATPEPGSMALGLFAAGATGLLALRRAKAKAAATQA